MSSLKQIHSLFIFSKRYEAICTFQETGQILASLTDSWLICQGKWNKMEQVVSNHCHQQREPDLFEEIGDGQCCGPERGKVAHVFRNAHPLEAFLLSLIPRPMTFFLCRENRFKKIALLEMHTPARWSHMTQIKLDATELAAPESESGSERSRPPTLLTMLRRWIAVQAKGMRKRPRRPHDCSACCRSFSSFSLC